MSASKSKPKQLNIRSDEAVALARDLSRRLNRTTGAVVLDALRAYGKQNSGEPDRLPEATIAANLEKLNTARLKLWGGKAPPPGLSSNHDWLYDENGLPK